MKELKESVSNNETPTDVSPGVLLFSGVLMIILGLIVSIYLFSNAKSGWSGLDNRMIIGGCVILTYQAIISYLCFKVADLFGRIKKLESQK